MSNSPSFVAHVLDLLAGVGPVTARAMFGGHLLSLAGTSIGLIADDRLYLRVDDELRPRLEAAGSEPFVYASKKGPMTMRAYWAMPESALDDAEEAAEWARLSVEAGARAERAKKPGKKKAPPKRLASTGRKRGGRP